MKKSQLVYGTETLEAELIYFFTKKGFKSMSPYEAKLEKIKSIPLYARLKLHNGTTIDVLVIKMRCSYRKHLAIWGKERNNFVQRYRVKNIICHINEVLYDEAFLFEDDLSTLTSANYAMDHICKDFNTIEDINGIVEAYKKSNPSQGLSLLYVYQPRYQSEVYGIIRDVRSYDAKARILTSDKVQLFMIQS